MTCAPRQEAEAKLRFAGFIAFQNSCKEEAPEALGPVVQKCHNPFTAESFRFWLDCWYFVTQAANAAADPDNDFAYFGDKPAMKACKVIFGFEEGASHSEQPDVCRVRP